MGGLFSLVFSTGIDKEVDRVFSYVEKNRNEIDVRVSRGEVLDDIFAPLKAELGFPDKSIDDCINLLPRLRRLASRAGESKLMYLYDKLRELIALQDSVAKSRHEQSFLQRYRHSNLLDEGGIERLKVVSSKINSMAFFNLSGSQTLICFLVDYSASMKLSMDNKDMEEEEAVGMEGPSSRIGAVAKQVLKFVEMPEGVGLTAEVALIGFGFKVGDEVQTVFPPVSMQRFSGQKQAYLNLLDEAEARMGGDTPLLGGLFHAAGLIGARCDSGDIGTVVLIIISDGAPNDSPIHDNDDVYREACDRVKRAGAHIVSGFLTGRNMVSPKTLYNTPPESGEWSDGAELMFECASSLPAAARELHFNAYLVEHGWTLEPDYKFFSQINHRGHLEEYLNIKTLWPLLQGLKRNDGQGEEEGEKEK